jgi:signal transduction histidine kinase
MSAYVIREELQVRGNLLWLFGLPAVVNVTLTHLSRVFGWSRFGNATSTGFGLAGWAGLVSLTGGVVSPFVAGFWLEIVLSAIALPPLGTLLTTVAAAGALLGQQVLFEPHGAAGRPVLQTGFLLSIGTLTFYASWRATRARRSLRLESEELTRRMRAIEEELAASRALSRIGERSARIVHSLKNTVHSLRGFATLAEGRGEGTRVQRQALAGLRLAIDGLEQTTREMLLAPGGSPEEATPVALEHTLDEVVREMAAQHSGLLWVTQVTKRLPAVALSSAVLREVLLIVAQNAAEASGDSGEVILKADVQEGVVRVVVEDQGPGFSDAARGAPLILPGVTTKPSGSGFGLFLARRLVEASGGTLTVGVAPRGGALVALQIPPWRG